MALQTFYVCEKCGHPTPVEQVAKEVSSNGHGNGNGTKSSTRRVRRKGHQSSRSTSRNDSQPLSKRDQRIIAAKKKGASNKQLSVRYRLSESRIGQITAGVA